MLLGTWRGNEHFEKLKKYCENLMEYIGSNKNPTPTTLPPTNKLGPLVWLTSLIAKNFCADLRSLPFLAWVNPQEYKLWDIVRGIQYCILTQNNWQKVWAKKKGGGGYWYSLKLLRIKLPNLWEIVYSPNHSITNTLHKVYFCILYSSIVEILEIGI